MDSSLLIAGLIFVLVMLLGLLAFYLLETFKKEKGIKERIRKETVPENNEEEFKQP